MSVVRTVRDIEPYDRQALERVLGRRLHDAEQVVIDVVGAPSPAPTDGTRTGHLLPDWCDVYAGLSDAEIDEIESAIVRSADSR